jgi:hypothetical protein
MKCAKYPLQEASNRIFEKYNEINNKKLSQTKNLIFQKEIFNESDNLDGTSYEKLILNEYCSFNINSINNKYIMLKNNDLAVIKKIIKFGENEVKFVVKKYNNISEVFNLSDVNLSSTYFGAFIVDLNLLSINQTYNSSVVFLTDIKCKCFFLQLSVCTASITTLCHDIYLES